MTLSFHASGLLGLASMFDPTSYIWNLGWIMIPLVPYFFILGLVAGYRRWRVNPKHVNELRANRSRLRKDRDQLLEEFGLERDDIVGMEVDDEVISSRSRRSSSSSSSSGSSSSSRSSSSRRSSSGRSSRRSSSGRSSSKSSRSRSRRRSGAESGSGKSASGQSTGAVEPRPGSETSDGATPGIQSVRGIRSLPPTAAEKADSERLEGSGPPGGEPEIQASVPATPPQEPSPPPEASAAAEPGPDPLSAYLGHLDAPAKTTEPPPSADKILGYLKHKSIENYEGFGPLFVDWPKKPDDLKRVAGIGEELERSLNDVGVFMLWQVAQWNDDNIRSIAEEVYQPEATVVAWVDEARRLIR